MKDNQEDLDLMKRINELENSLSIALDINDKYQRENLALEKRAREAEEDNKRLSLQIEDKINQIRRSGL